MLDRLRIHEVQNVAYIGCRRSMLDLFVLLASVPIDSLLLIMLCAAPKPEFCIVVHDGPIITMQRSPFFKEVILCVGGWTFSIWKEGVNVRIYSGLRLVVKT